MNRDQIHNAALTEAGLIFTEATKEPWRHYVDQLTHALAEYEATKENVMEAKELQARVGNRRGSGAWRVDNGLANLR